jgi:hypothetical protein
LVFSRHSRRLGQRKNRLCEVIHIRRDFLRAA